MHGRRILICGAGIAGPACTIWLRRHGISVVLVEKAPSLRDGGQNVDLKCAAQKVVALMGLDQRIEALNTPECGQKWLDAHGRLVATFPKGAFGSLTSDFEILREDIARVLSDATRTECEYRFGTHVTSFDEVDCGIFANFNEGASKIFDLAISAGVNSRTRDREFSEGPIILASARSWLFQLSEAGDGRLLGMLGQRARRYMHHGSPRKRSSHHRAGDISGKALRPGHPCASRGQSDLACGARGPRHDGGAHQRRAGPRRRRLLRSNDADSGLGLVSGPIGAAWRRRTLPDRVHWEGTALSLVAAYVLAGEIKRNSSHVDAFGAH